MKAHRYFVPDLTPKDRPELRAGRFRYIFVAESPHVSEVEAAEAKDRRPLCGAAGRVWWSALGMTDPLTADRLIAFCRKHRIAVMNAVQFPLDPKIVERVGDSKADPVRTVGFSKALGPDHYKKSSEKDRTRVLRALRERLLDPALGDARIIALGNDADWFIRRALTEEELNERQVFKVPHPSAWWRRGGYFGKQARAALQELFK